MHTFQPYPIDLIEFNPFTKIGTEWAPVPSMERIPSIHVKQAAFA